MDAITIKLKDIRIPADLLTSRAYGREAAYLMNYAREIGETEHYLTFRDYLFNGITGPRLLTAAGAISLLKHHDEQTRLRASRLRRFAYEALH